MIERTPSRRAPRRRGWFALAAMLAMLLMPALSRPGVDADIISVRLPMVLCLASSSTQPDVHPSPSDSPAPAAADAGCPFCATGAQPVLPSAIRGWQPLSASSEAPGEVACTGAMAARRGQVRVRGPPVAGPMRAAAPVGDRRVPDALAA